MRYSTAQPDSVAAAVVRSASVERPSFSARSSVRRADDPSAEARRPSRPPRRATNDRLSALRRVLGSRTGVLPGVRRPPSGLPCRWHRDSRIGMDRACSNRGRRRADRRGGCSNRGRRFSERSGGHHGHRWIRNRAGSEHASVAGRHRPVGDLRVATRRRRVDRGARLSASDGRSDGRTRARPQGTYTRTLTGRRARLVAVCEPASRLLDRVHGCLLVRSRGDECTRGRATVLTHCCRATRRLVMTCCRHRRPSSRTL